MKLKQLLENELAVRNAFVEEIRNVLNENCDIGIGKIKRGELHDYLYHHFGFHGRSGNYFGSFINSTMVELGFRPSYSNGHRVYFGLKFKNK